MFSFFCTLFILLLSSCNIFAPINRKTTDQDYLDAANKCLHENDYACAIEYYSEIQNPLLRSQKLCTGYLAKSGVSIIIFLDIINSNASASLLGTLANALVPWNETKAQDATSAALYCGEFGTLSTGSDLGTLLKVVGAFVDCAMRMSRTDRFVATSNSDTTCDTAGNNNGKVTKSDISSSLDGSIPSGGTGMCSSDVIACTKNIALLSANQTEDAGLNSLGSAIENLPDALKTEVTAQLASLPRAAILDTLTE